MELWLARHGESTWNHARRFQGRADAELSARGRAQARALAEALAGEGVGGVYTSALVRARETAATCAARLGRVPAVVPDLREVGLGDWEGLAVETVIERYGDHYWRWLQAPADHPPPGGEPLVALAARVTAAVESNRARHAGGRVLAVAHGGTIASFLCGCLGLGANAVWRLRLDNASVTRVAWPAARLLALNDTRHLSRGARGASGLPAGGAA